jgi:glycosyltransferase involved in cell wall biosynthesis
MRVAVVHSFYTDRQPSGENNVVRDQVAALRSAGHDVELIARRTDDYAGERMYAARSGLTVMTGRGPSPDQELAGFRPDVVHLHNTFPNWGTAWMKKWGHKTVLTVHNYRPFCANGLLFRDGRPCQDCLGMPVLPAVRHRCYRASALASAPLAVASAPWGALRRVPVTARRVLCLNQQSAAVYERVLGRSVEVVPNFVPAGPRISSPEREGWVYVGRLSGEKGVEELLRRWPAGVPLDLVGDGPLADAVRAVARHRPEVRMVGTVAREQLLHRLGTYKGLVLPSMCAEQLPTAVLEAMAAGTPSVLSHHVNAAEQLRTLGAAETFDPVAPGLEGVLGEVDIAWSSMSAAARAVYEKEYAPEVWLARVQAIYREVVNSDFD